MISQISADTLDSKLRIIESILGIARPAYDVEQRLEEIIDLLFEESQEYENDESAIDAATERIDELERTLQKIHDLIGDI